MLPIIVPEWEDFDSETNKITRGIETTLILEHSLMSISKWESKYHKPFLSNKNPTEEEQLDYIRFMTVSSTNHGKNADDVYRHLGMNNLLAIQRYISDPMTATTFSDKGKKGGKSEIITSEVIYYHMTAFGIPFECQKWHLNRLMTLLQVAAVKNQSPKKMGKRETMSMYKSLNEARRAKHHSKG